MFTEYENTVVATINFLKLLKVKANKFTVAESLQNHPNYPSLLSISEVLAKLQITNAAAKIDKKDIEQLPVPFIAFTSYKEFTFIVVNKVEGNNIEAFTKDFNKTKSFSKEDFLMHWTGVYFIAETNEQSGEKGYKKNKVDHFFSWLTPLLLIILLTISSVLFLYQNVINAKIINALPIYFQFTILSAGLVVATMLLWYEIDRTNPVLHKVCTGIIKGNCNAILLGKASRIFRWLSWSEVGFFYFAGGFITLLFSGNINEAISIIAWLNIMALPYVIFSIYYQGAIAKEWCLFCLSVQVLLILGGINVFKFHLFTSVFALSYLTIFKSAILYFLPVTLWYSLKPIVLKLQASKQIKRELIRIKFSTEIFQTLLKNQKLITSSTDGLGIDIGDPLAKNTIIKVCNPYCGPCAKMHPEIEKLLEENNNIKAKIIFTVRSDETDNRIKPVKHLLAIAKKGNEQLTKQALDDWYLAEKKDYEVFAKKYPMNGELSEQLDKIKAMEKWCNETDIQFTPTIFINGYQLPDTYNIESLNYLLEE